MKKTVVTAGAFDTKGPDYAFLVRRLRSHGVNVLTVDFGVLGDPPFPPDVTSAEVALAGGEDLSSLRHSKDKTRAMRAMAAGLSRILLRLHEEGRLDGVCGMGGSGATTILGAGVRALPIGVPKLLISTVASGDVSTYVSTADVTLMHSVVDVAGLNRISRPIYSNAAAAIAGMAQAERPEATGERPIVAASMFGNTTACVDKARESLNLAGWEVLVFHATGSGGRVIQRLAAEGFLSGLLDLTMTELADEVCGGVFTAGLERVHIGASSNIPAVLAPGCVDMCNFGPVETVPSIYRSRLLYEWNANVTLLRTNVEENRRIGALIAETANQCRGPVAVLLPLRGVSMLGSPGQPFRDEAADHACFEAIRAGLREGIPVIEVDSNINDPVFADRATQTFLVMTARAAGSASRADGWKIIL